MNLQLFRKISKYHSSSRLLEELFIVYYRMCYQNIHSGSKFLGTLRLWGKLCFRQNNTNNLDAKFCCSVKNFWGKTKTKKKTQKKQEEETMQNQTFFAILEQVMSEAMLIIVKHCKLETRPGCSWSFCCLILLDSYFNMRLTLNANVMGCN